MVAVLRELWVEEGGEEVGGEEGEMGGLVVVCGYGRGNVQVWPVVAKFLGRRDAKT